MLHCSFKSLCCAAILLWFIRMSFRFPIIPCFANVLYFLLFVEFFLLLAFLPVILSFLFLSGFAFGLLLRA